MKNMTVVKEGSKIYLEDAAGDKIQLYKPVLAKSDGGEIELTAGSVLDIVAAVGYYKAPQLRNSSGDEITVTKQVEATPDVDIKVKSGDKVVIYNLGSTEVLAGQDGNVRATVMTLNGNPLVLGENYALPELTPVVQPAGTVELAPCTCTFLVV